MGNTVQKMELSNSTLEVNPTVSIIDIKVDVTPSNEAKDIEIENRDTIFAEINEALGRSDHPSVEYVMARPFSKYSIFGLFGLNFNWYGHSAIIYKMPDGQRKLVNVVGNKIKGFITYHTPEEYLFTRNSDQGGIYNRDFISIRVQDVPPESIVAMDKKFEEMFEKGVEGKMRFDIGLGPMYNTFREWFPNFDMAERGNCARWASIGLKEAGLIKRKSTWPKSIFIDILENYAETNGKSYDNMDIVSYECMYHVTKDYGLNLKNPLEFVSPLQVFRNLSNVP